jgi:anti-sigma28 factor (negative regulator of flagellin synthesis)
VPDEQDRRSSKRRMSRAAPPNAEDGAARPSSRKRASNPRRIEASEPVDFKAAAQRLTVRAAQITRLKSEVEQGTYLADAGETARAMERRSDA